MRLSGPGAAAFVRKLCGAEVGAGVPRLARLRLAGEELDEAIVCHLPGAVFELHLHGSPVLLEQLARALPVTAPAASSAVPESSLEALARADLARAPAEAAARILLDQAEGALSRELRSLVAADAAARERAVDGLLARARAARFALRPTVIVLAGPVNAGKSTLFNALLGEARAIVDATPGTTRDVLRERALFGAWPVWLVDTAGEREADYEGVDSEADDVEREGWGRGRRARAEADLVLWLAPVSGAEPAVPRAPRSATVRTFADLRPGTGPAGGAISALRDPAGARARISEIFRTTFGLPEDPWTPGAAVPFTDEIAAAIADLRGAEDATLERRVEAIVAGDGGNGEHGAAFARPRARA